MIHALISGEERLLTAETLLMHKNTIENEFPKYLKHWYSGPKNNLSFENQVTVPYNNSIVDSSSDNDGIAGFEDDDLWL